MLAWVWCWGFVVTGSARQATQYFRAWWRIVKWMALAGMVFALLVLDISPLQ